MKTLIAAIGSVLVLGVVLHSTGAVPQQDSAHPMAGLHGHFSEQPLPNSNEYPEHLNEVEDESEPVTVSIAQNDFDLCTDPFYVGFYESTKMVYGVGIENVTVAALEDKTFSYIRSQEQFSPEQAEGWVEHIKDIPGQLVMIIREDPAVLDSCANFSVALVGPP